MEYYKKTIDINSLTYFYKKLVAILNARLMEKQDVIISIDTNDIDDLTYYIDN